ncbi:MAG: YceI family protein [Bacteroidota bacterium]
MAWNIDPSHSQVQFTVRHMMISNARGRFEEFTGTVEFDPEHLENLKVDVTIDAASINTRDPQRDGHLKSPDFLNVEQFPNMTFKSTSVEKVSNTELRINGDLTIRDTTHPVVLQTEFNGVVASPWGTTSAGFSAHTKINRKEWGLVWNQTLETGGLLVGEDVKIELELELVKAPVAEAVA